MLSLRPGSDVKLLSLPSGIIASMLSSLWRCYLNGLGSLWNSMSMCYTTLVVAIVSLMWQYLRTISKCQGIGTNNCKWVLSLWPCGCCSHATVVIMWSLVPQYPYVVLLLMWSCCRWCGNTRAWYKNTKVKQRIANEDYYCGHVIVATMRVLMYKCSCVTWLH